MWARRTGLRSGTWGGRCAGRTELRHHSEIRRSAVRLGWANRSRAIIASVRALSSTSTRSVACGITWARMSMCGSHAAQDESLLARIFFEAWGHYRARVDAWCPSYSMQGTLPNFVFGQMPPSKMRYAHHAAWFVSTGERKTQQAHSMVVTPFSLVCASLTPWTSNPISRWHRRRHGGHGPHWPSRDMAEFALRRGICA